MKAKMAKVRAAKAGKKTKAKPKTKPKAKKEDNLEERKAVVDAMVSRSDAGLNANGPKPVEKKKAPSAIEQKSWVISNMSQLSQMPRDQLDKAIHFMRFELHKAIAQGEIIENFVWYERGRLETNKKDKPKDNDPLS